MKVQIAYALVSSPQDLFFQEIWASIYSVRLYEADREIRVLCDQPTYDYISQYNDFTSLVTEFVIIDVPNVYNAKLRSREIKTTVREHISGPFLFLDTDTICAGTLDELDTLYFDICAVPEYHLPLSIHPFRTFVSNRASKFYEIDINDAEFFHNSGVLLVKDSQVAHNFYKLWHKNWEYSVHVVGNSQDEPPLIKTDKELGYIIRQLPGEYNCQICMSVKYLANAKLIHFMHFDYPRNQSFNPFMTKDIYRHIKDDNGISLYTSIMIKNVKQAFESPSCVVGWSTIKFLMSPAASIFEDVYNEGGAASWLMLKFAKYLGYCHKIIHKIKKRDV